MTDKQIRKSYRLPRTACRIMVSNSFGDPVLAPVVESFPAKSGSDGGIVFAASDGILRQIRDEEVGRFTTGSQVWWCWKKDLKTALSKVQKYSIDRIESELRRAESLKISLRRLKSQDWGKIARAY